MDTEIDDRKSGVGNPEPAEPAQTFSFFQRIKASFIAWAARCAISLICPTLRWTVSLEDGAPSNEEPTPMLHVFWHRCTIPAAWYFRRRGIVVLTSRSFDGEIISRVVEKFGYGTARGSSSRGGAAGLLELRSSVEAGRQVAFTIDGPRGPMYVAKPGPVLLARATKVPIRCFHIALQEPWELRSWDRFMVPRPFSRAVIRVARLIHVPERGNDADSLAQMQATLDRVRADAEELVQHPR